MPFLPPIIKMLSYLLEILRFFAHTNGITFYCPITAQILHLFEICLCHLDDDIGLVKYSFYSMA